MNEQTVRCEAPPLTFGTLITFHWNGGRVIPRRWTLVNIKLRGRIENDRRKIDASSCARKGTKELKG
ncbi:MAG: hypothetical protein ACTS6A_01645 [Candidatus Hodgkinia cicadicola]